MVRLVSISTASMKTVIPNQGNFQLTAADHLTYEAEKLFGIDLNDDDVQGRNVQEFDRDAFITANNIETFDGASDNKTLLTDIQSGELLSANSSDISIQTLLTNKDGSSFVSADYHTAIDVTEHETTKMMVLSNLTVFCRSLLHQNPLKKLSKKIKDLITIMFS